MESGLKDRVVLITGASGGIGSECAREFAAEGAKLVLHAHTHRAAVEKLIPQLEVECLAVQADLTDEEQAGRIFRETIDRFSRVDVLVANAAIWRPEVTPIHEMSLERWNEAIAADQTSVFLCAREFFRHLEAERPSNASMVIVGSTAAVFGEEGHAEYAAAKAAITYGLTRTLKNEIVRLVPAGRVNAVSPGWTLTGMAERAMEDEREMKRALQTRAIKKIARVEEIARAVVFLASDRLAGHITGQILTVAGGMEGRLLHDPEEVDPGTA